MGKIYTIGGKDIELHTIGELANKLERQGQTIRKWERLGIIPAATYRAQSGRRLYSTDQIKAIKKMVDEYDLKQGLPIPDGFKEAVFKAFEEATEKFDEVENNG